MLFRKGEGTTFYSGADRSSGALRAESRGLESVIDAAKRLGFRPWKTLQEASDDFDRSAPESHHIRTREGVKLLAYREPGEWRRVIESSQEAKQRRLEELREKRDEAKARKERDAQASKDNAEFRKRAIAEYGSLQAYWDHVRPARNPSVREETTVTVRFNPTRQNLTDRAYRYRAVATGPEGPKLCTFCGATRNLMVGHLDGHESHGEPDNLHWTCRSCNSHHANALKRARMGKRTAQFNPSKSGGASNIGEWIQAVGAIAARKQTKPKGPIGSSDRNRGLSSTMSVSDAVAMIRATPASKRADFAARLKKSGGGRRASGGGDIPF